MFLVINVASMGLESLMMQTEIFADADPECAERAGERVLPARLLHPRRRRFRPCPPSPPLPHYLRYQFELYHGGLPRLPTAVRR